MVIAIPPSHTDQARVRKLGLCEVLELLSILCRVKRQGATNLELKDLIKVCLRPGITSNISWGAESGYDSYAF